MSWMWRLATWLDRRKRQHEPVWAPCQCGYCKYRRR